MTLCHTLVGYLVSFVYISLNCVFLREEAELPTGPPPPSPTLISRPRRFNKSVPTLISRPRRFVKSTPTLISGSRRFCTVYILRGPYH